MQDLKARNLKGALARSAIRSAYHGNIDKPAPVRAGGVATAAFAAAGIGQGVAPVQARTLTAGN